MKHLNHNIHHLVSALVIVSSCALLPAPAHAQKNSATGYVGWTTGGDTIASKPLIGASLMLTGGFVGPEFDITYVPSFYSSDNSNNNSNTPGPKGSLTLLNGGIAIRFPAGQAPVTPYIAFGGGYARSSQRIENNTGTETSSSSSDIDLSIGGGAIYHVNKRLGIRGDLRMIRIFDVHDISEQDDDNLHISHLTLWRISVGATLQF